MKSASGLPFTCSPTLCSFNFFSFLMSSCAVEAHGWNNSVGQAACDSCSLHPAKEGHSPLHESKVNLGTSASWKMRFWVQTLWQSNINERQAFISSDSWISMRRFLITFLRDSPSTFGLSGRSGNGATWPRPCPCCPCASVASSGCRSAGSATATS